MKSYGLHENSFPGPGLINAMQRAKSYLVESEKVDIISEVRYYCYIMEVIKYSCKRVRYSSLTTLEKNTFM